MRFAYADPPYIGCAHLYPEKREIDHDELIARLLSDYPDGWALSASSPFCIRRRPSATCILDIPTKLGVNVKGKQVAIVSVQRTTTSK